MKELAYVLLKIFLDRASNNTIIIPMDRYKLLYQALGKETLNQWALDNNVTIKVRG